MSNPRVPKPFPNVLRRFVPPGPKWPSELLAYESQLLTRYPSTTSICAPTFSTGRLSVGKHGVRCSTRMAKTFSSAFHSRLTEELRWAGTAKLPKVHYHQYRQPEESTAKTLARINERVTESTARTNERGSARTTEPTESTARTGERTSFNYTTIRQVEEELTRETSWIPSEDKTPEEIIGTATEGFFARSNDQTVRAYESGNALDVEYFVHPLAAGFFLSSQIRDRDEQVVAKDYSGACILIREAASVDSSKDQYGTCVRSIQSSWNPATRDRD